MLNNEIFISQAKLFNNILTIENLKYVNDNNILVYSNFNDIALEDITLEYNSALLEQIIWTYDKNNYRIPYVDGIKISKIKIDNSYNIYDCISSASLINNDDIICGEKFLSICDVFIGSINSINANPNNKYIQQNIFNIEQNINDIINKYEKIFIKTDDLLIFYNKIQSYNININNKIIVSHNSDHGIDDKYLQFLNNVKKQYSQNCLKIHRNLEPIPIGIENSQWFNYDILHKIRNRTDLKKEKHIYFMFSLSTHFSRTECYEFFKNKLEWNTKLSKEEYFVELKKHKFAICPRGNGLDTHRIWECLYLDVIPIMLKRDSLGINNLPIIYLDDWNDLDINNIHTCFKNIKYSKITFNYYKELI